MTRRNPCRRIKRSEAEVVWDDPSQSRGNRQKVWAHNLTEDEVEAIAEKYGSQPSPRPLSQSGQIDPQSGERAERACIGTAAAPVPRIDRRVTGGARKRQGLSLSDVAERTGMDRAAIHKLEIGPNSNPTHATLPRYATALGTRIEWHLETIPKKTTSP